MQSINAWLMHLLTRRLPVPERDLRRNLGVNLKDTLDACLATPNATQLEPIQCRRLSIYGRGLYSQ